MKQTCAEFLGAAARPLVNVMHFDELSSTASKTSGLHSGFITGRLGMLIRSFE